MENRYGLNKQLGTDVKGRSYHGRYNSGAGKNCRGSGCMRGYGTWSVSLQIFVRQAVFQE